MNKVRIVANKKKIAANKKKIAANKKKIAADKNKCCENKKLFDQSLDGETKNIINSIFNKIQNFQHE